MLDLKDLDNKSLFLLFDCLPIEVHIWDIVRDHAGEIKTWKLRYVNPATLSSWKRDSLEEIEGLTTDEIFGEGSTAHYMNIVQQIMNEKAPYSFQDYFAQLERHFQFTTIPFKDSFFTIGTDITRFIKQNEAEISKQKVLEGIISERTVALEDTVSKLTIALEESERLKEELKKMAISDPLTGLYNRRYLDDFLNREIRRCSRTKHSLGAIFIDLDHFKKINDTYGHDVGDLVLEEVSKLIKENIRSSDIACRYGGDEFVVLLPETSHASTQQKANKILSALEKTEWPRQYNDFGGVSLSVGVATYPDHAKDASELLRNADKALFLAKENGRNRIQCASQSNEA